MHWMPNPLAALTVAAAVAVAPVAVAQETVEFTLNVQKAGDPIEAAVVEVVNNDDPNVKLSGVTDYAGRVAFDVPRGTYTYRVITEGSEPVIGTVELNRPQDTTTRFTGPEREVDFTWSDFTVVAGGRSAIHPQIEGDASGVTVEQKAGPQWVEVFDDGTIEAMPPASMAPGDYEVAVRTSAGQVSTVNVKVTGPETLRALQYPVTSVEQGRKATSAAPMATISHQGRDFPSQPVPAGVVFSTDATNAQVDARTGRVTLDTAGVDARVGETIEVPVVGTLPNGETTTARAVFYITALPAAKRYTPGWEPVTAAPGERAEVEQTGEQTMPKDAEYWWLRADNPELSGWRISIDPTTGRISATPSHSAQEGVLKVRVSYADGSQSRVKVPLKPAAPSAQPQEHTAQVLPPGKEMEIFDAAESDVEIIDNGGVRLDVDKATGKVSATVPEDAMRGADYEVTLRVDGQDKKVRLTADTPQDEFATSSVRDAWWIPLVMVAMAAIGAGAQWALSQLGGGK